MLFYSYISKNFRARLLPGIQIHVVIMIIKKNWWGNAKLLKWPNRNYDLATFQELCVSSTVYLLYLATFKTFVWISPSTCLSGYFHEFCVNFNSFFSIFWSLSELLCELNQSIRPHFHEVFVNHLYSILIFLTFRTFVWNPTVYLLYLATFRTFVWTPPAYLLYLATFRRFVWTTNAYLSVLSWLLWQLNSLPFALRHFEGFCMNYSS